MRLTLSPFAVALTLIAAPLGSLVAQERGAARHDRVILRNGDVFTGAVQRLDGSTLHLDTEHGALVIRRDRIERLVLGGAPDPQAAPSPPRSEGVLEREAREILEANQTSLGAELEALFTRDTLRELFQRPGLPPLHGSYEDLLAEVLGDLDEARAAAPSPRLGVAVQVGRSGQLEVTEVWSGSVAATLGLRPGDRILRVQGQPLAALEDLGRALSGVPGGGLLRLEVDRGGLTFELRTALP